jgi:DNA-binding NarL/FixJ family response regulator
VAATGRVRPPRLQRAGALAADPDLELLTTREQQLLEHIARRSLRGGGPQAGRLARTLETHVAAVARKLHLSTRHQLARWASEHKLID